MDAGLFSLSAISDEYPITFEVPTQRLTKVLRNREEVEKYLNNEAAFWDALPVKIGPIASLGDFIHQASDPLGFRAAASSLTQLRKRADQPEAGKAALENFLALATVLSESPEGAQIGELLNSSPFAAFAAALIAASTVSPNALLNVAAQRANIVQVIALGSGARELARGDASDRPRFRQLNDQSKKLFDELVQAKDDLSTWGDAQRTTESELSQKFETDGKELVEKAARKFGELLDSATSDIEAFKKKVRQDVVSEVPTTFWNTKADGHMRTAAIFGALFAAVVVAGVVWVDRSAIDLVADGYARIVSANPDAGPLVGIVPLALVSVPVLAFAWVLRHVSRLIVQNLSLGADARLRGTITSTYRALASDRAMNDAELAIVLQALFRPIDGKDHTEIAPPSLTELLKVGKD